MWTRVELKNKAKAVLRKSYWTAFWVSLVMALAGGREMAPRASWHWKESDTQYFKSTFLNGNADKMWLFVVTFIMIIAVIVLVVAILRLFLGYQLEVGGKRYFIKSAQGETEFNHLGFCFKKHRYVDVIKAMLWRDSFNFLWYLLFLIPGVVKYYEYKMVPYLLAENPHIGYRRALDLSKEMTRGQKMDMFVLDLSFLGWYILGMFVFIVGTCLVMPYDNATKAELYLVLRQEALDSGLCTEDELTLDFEGEAI